MRARGFTIMEVLLAVALLVVLSAGLSNLMWGAASMSVAARKEAGRERGVMSFLEHLEADVASAVASGPGGEPGIVGSETELAILSRRAWLSLGDGASRAIGRSRYVAGERVTLTRDDAAEGTLLTGVARVTFRYHDGRAWAETFDSLDAGRLPAAIEVRVWFGAASVPGGVSGHSPGGRGGRQAVPDVERVLVVPDGPGV